MYHASKRKKISISKILDKECMEGGLRKTVSPKTGAEKATTGGHPLVMGRLCGGGTWLWCTAASHSPLGR